MTMATSHDGTRASRLSHRSVARHRHSRHGVYPRRLTHYSVDSTCYHQGSITASGGGVYVGEVANNFLPLGTHIELDHPVFGRRFFNVEDRIGWGSELDIYGPSEWACEQYGRQQIGFWTVR
jgi:hypothetical protein